MNKKLSFPIAAVFFALSAIYDLYYVFLARFDFFFVLRFVSSIFLLVALLVTAFGKKDIGMLLFSAIACQTLIRILFVLRSFYIVNILRLVAWLMILVLALDACRVTNKVSSVAAVCRKVFFVPAVLVFLAALIPLIRGVANLYSFGMILRQLIPFLFNIFEVLGVFFLAAWLVNPYTKGQPAVASGTYGINSTEVQTDEEAYCDLVKHILLCLFTFGIWSLIWIYRTTKYLNKAPHAEQYNPTNQLLLCMFVPFYQIYWFYQHGQRLDALSRAKNLNNSDMATLCLIFGIFVPVVACILMQDRINTLCTIKAAAPAPAPTAPVSVAPTPAAPAPASSVAGDLKQYKELLDSGIITQEEFDAKKKQLLGL